MTPADIGALRSDYSSLVERLNKQATCVYLLAPHNAGADDVSRGLREAATALLSLLARVDQAETACEAAQDRAARAQKDAERYRYLRDTVKYTDNIRLFCHGVIAIGEKLDAAIDAARSAGEGDK